MYLWFSDDERNSINCLQMTDSLRVCTLYECLHPLLIPSGIVSVHFATVVLKSRVVGVTEIEDFLHENTKVLTAPPRAHLDMYVCSQRRMAVRASAIQSVSKQTGRP